MSSPYNRAAAFVEYCKGTQLEEISFALAIPYDHLKRWEREEKWALLMPKLSVATVPRGGSDDNAERAMTRIKENREKNLVIAEKLREDLLNTVTKLVDGTLTITKVFANGTQVEVEPSLRDRNDLALYARNVAEQTYRALGDIESAKNPPGDSGMPSAGQITIVLPAPVAAPRQIRAYDVVSEVVRLDEPALLPPANGSLNRSAPVSNSLEPKGIVDVEEVRAPEAGHPTMAPNTSIPV